MSRDQEPTWKHDGVRVIPGGSPNGNTPQTPVMDRKAAINFARRPPADEADEITPAFLPSRDEL